MKLLFDAHLPPSIAPWVFETFGIEAFSFDYLGWRSKEDVEIFFLARKEAETIVITKDQNFVVLLKENDMVEING